MNKYYIGIDGGGTYTKAVVVSDCGDLVFRTEGKTINYCAVPFDTARKNLEDVFDSITKSVATENISRVFIGCSALESKADAETTKRLMGRYSHINADMDSDLYVALFGHSFGSPGAMIISGTGSMGIAMTNEEEIITCGGWGYAFGDEGSAYYIAVEGLRHVSKMADGREEKTKLYYAALNYYGVDDLYEIIDMIYLPAYSRNKVAGFAKIVAECAREGDRISADILDRSVRELSCLASALLRHFGKFDSIAVYGGVLLHNEYVFSGLEKSLCAEFPGISVSFPKALPEFGAVAAAMKADGVLCEAVIEKLCKLK